MQEYKSHTKGAAEVLHDRAYLNGYIVRTDHGVI